MKRITSQFMMLLVIAALALSASGASAQAYEANAVDGAEHAIAVTAANEMAAAFAASFA